MANHQKEKALKQYFKAFPLVDGTGLERRCVNFMGYNPHIKPDYSPLFVLLLLSIGKKNTLEKSKVWSKVWSKLVLFKDGVNASCYAGCNDIFQI